MGECVLNKRLIILVTALSVLVGFACRSRKRSAKVGTDAMRVIVTLKNLDDVNQTKLVALEYQMNCADAAEWSLGEPSEADPEQVTFLVKKVASGTTCSFRVLDPNPPADFNFLGTRGVVYEADGGVVLSARAGGQLFGEVLLNRKYKLKPGNAKVKVPVHFKDGMPPDLDLKASVAELKCTPEFQGAAVGLNDIAAAAKTGHYVFDSGLTSGVTYKCRQIQISLGKQKNAFYGKADIELALKKPGEDIQTPVVELQEIEVLTADGVVIVVTPGEACKQGEVFDVDLGRCVPRP